MEYTIKDVCQKLNLTVYTVRHYCDQGLVPHLKRDCHGNRLFDEQSLNWLQAAVFLRGSGLSIPEIKEYFDLCLEGEETIVQRQQILIQLKEKTEKEFQDIQKRLSCISQKVEHCQEIIDGLCEDDCNPLNW